ncbi:MAG: mandelate racemase/muconate lactonizing enzyme family protein, partial [Chloroflexota bacterium]|nr:mandelate racemase/muconate lactonizing enzyme family protein [Chloroflexota bacterium]
MTVVARVEPIPVSYPEPNDFDALRHLCLVRITTDNGLVGWGEAIAQFPEASLATRAIMEGMADRVVGRDPVHTRAISESLKDQAWWYGHGGGIASNAIAAIDIALWDLKGKILGRSVLDLLGGPVHERLPAVASSHAHHADIGRMVEEAQEWLAPGLHGVKVGFGKRGDARLGYEHDRDVEYMRRMREGLGPAAMIMIDCGWAVKWDVMTAVRRVRAFEEHGLHWIEEPLGAWDLEGYANLRGKTTTMIA